MADKFKKIEKDFLLSDSSLNVYKYRLLTKGYLLAEFKKNPIGYYMHGTDEYPREQGVLVKWDDLRIDGDNVYGKPCINLNHPRGQRTVDEVESGFLNAASFGHFIVLEISSNPSDYLEGQDGPSVSKWFNRECSLVDIPGNYNALSDLYDEANNPLKLEDLKAQLNNQQNNIMKEIKVTAEQLQLMNLKADADGMAFTTALQDLIAKAAKVDELNTKLNAAISEKETVENSLKTLKEKTENDTIENLIAKGVYDKKLTVEVGGQLKDAYKGKPDELKKLIDAMPAYTGVVKTLEGIENKLKDLAAKDWDSLDKEGKLEDLKVADFEEFKNKYKAKFGSEYKQ